MIKYPNIYLENSHYFQIGERIYINGLMATIIHITNDNYIVSFDHTFNYVKFDELENCLKELYETGMCLKIKIINKDKTQLIDFFFIPSKIDILNYDLFKYCGDHTKIKSDYATRVLTDYWLSTQEINNYAMAIGHNGQIKSRHKNDLISFPIFFQIKKQNIIEIIDKEKKFDRNPIVC